jgi:hypothetical protein
MLLPTHFGNFKLTMPLGWISMDFPQNLVLIWISANTNVNQVI